MQENLGFLKVSSAVIKIAAWIFLLLGIVGSMSILSGLVPGQPRWTGVLVLIIYTFSFFFFYFIVKIAEILIKIIKAIDKE